jgi:hypothetical protein
MTYFKMLYLRFYDRTEDNYENPRFAEQVQFQNQVISTYSSTCINQKLLSWQYWIGAKGVSCNADGIEFIQLRWHQ